jgi:hypothetical protein
VVVLLLLCLFVCKRLIDASQRKKCWIALPRPRSTREVTCQTD